MGKLYIRATLFIEVDVEAKEGEELHYEDVEQLARDSISLDETNEDAVMVVEEWSNDVLEENFCV